MKIRQSLFISLAFTAGIIAGSKTAMTISPAQAGTFNWAKISEEPGFRAAVVEVINSCIVDNGIIYCN